MPTVNADLSWAIEDVRDRLNGYALFKAYDEGDHRLLFASDKYKNAFGDLFREFADNMCDEVVDGITDRLQIVSWTAEEAFLNRMADELWKRNKGEARTGAIHRNAFREGDGFAIVQQSPTGQAHAFRQDPRCMAVRYSSEDPDRIDVAAKVWKAARRYRVNLYYPGDRVEKYASKGMGASGGMPQAGAFTLLQAGDPDLRDEEEAIMVDLDPHGPVYHFPNGTLSEYGRSILAPVIPLQDALNKSVADMLVAMEYHAYPQRWATGLTVEVDPLTGQERDPFQAGEGRLWRSGSKDATFGQFDPATMEGFLSVQDSFKVEIGRKGYLPPYAITLRSGTAMAPSGISLLVQEGRTIKNARDRQRDWSDEHREMMAHQIRLEVGTDSITGRDLDCEWADPATRDEHGLIELLLMKEQIGVPRRQLLLEAGYDRDEVEKWLAEADTQAEEARIAAQVMAGGRTSAIRTNQALALPPGPTAPAGGQTALASA